jgi:hypothetical protein
MLYAACMPPEYHAGSDAGWRPWRETPQGRPATAKQHQEVSKCISSYCLLMLDAAHPAANGLLAATQDGVHGARNCRGALQQQSTLQNHISVIR